MRKKRLTQLFIDVMLGVFITLNFIVENYTALFFMLLGLAGMVIIILADDRCGGER